MSYILYLYGKDYYIYNTRTYKQSIDFRSDKICFKCGRLYRVFYFFEDELVRCNCSSYKSLAFVREHKMFETKTLRDMLSYISDLQLIEELKK